MHLGIHASLFEVPIPQCTKRQITHFVGASLVMVSSSSKEFAHVITISTSCFGCHKILSYLPLLYSPGLHIYYAIVLQVRKGNPETGERTIIIEQYCTWFHIVRMRVIFVAIMFHMALRWSTRNKFQN